MNNPIISIIVPVYNVEQYLPQCIDSIRSQSMSDFELLLVDDGSTDTSGKICDDYASKDNRIRVIHIPNSGVSFARNTGIEKACGEWITFVDSDDWVDGNFLEDFRIEMNCKADMICQGLKYIDHATGSVKRERRFGEDWIEAPDKEGKMEKYDVLSFGVTVCKCFKRSVIEVNSIRFDEQVAYHEDHIFALSYIYHAHIIAIVDACGYSYRCGHNTSSLSKRRHPCKNQVRAGQCMMQCLKDISTVYHLSDAYFKRIATFCLSPKISAVRMAFEGKASFNEMKRMMAPVSEFARYYEPADKRYRIIRYLAKGPSGFALYLFFILLSKITNK